MTAQIEVLAILLAAIALFILDRWRYDVTAMLALLALALLRILPERELFSGFGNPAVITVAGVMVVSRALWNVGLVDAITAW
ncbi:MAG: SLC13 family permease, partial [Steroidobacteraceae bacterium]